MSYQQPPPPPSNQNTANYGQNYAQQGGAYGR